MKIETDIQRIERLAKQKEVKNWRFRSFLKISISSRRLDEIVHRLNREVTEQIDCQACAHCCKAITPSLDERDIQRLAGHLNMTEDDFTQEYLVKDEEGDIVFRSLPCRFLSGNSCTVYEHRPETCRSYPHLHKKDFVHRLMGVCINAEVCPIVYNVYEQLKMELRWK